MLHHVLVDLVMNPAQVAPRIRTGRPNHRKNCMTWEDSGSGAELLLHPCDRVDLVPGVLRQRESSCYARQIYRTSFPHFEDGAGSFWLAEAASQSF